MAHQITGPTGKFPLGRPITTGDRGGLVVVFAVSKKVGRAMMDFGATITELSSPASEATETAKHMQRILKETFGELKCDASSFPFTVVANRQRGTVEIHFGMPMYTLVANPEVFWVWADKVISAASKITVH